MKGEPKADLRRRMREVASARSETAELSAKLVGHLRNWSGWKESRRICAFSPLSGEPGVLQPWPDGCELALPKMVGDSLVALRVRSADELVRGAFGVLEPPDGALEVASGAIDLILVPGLAFDIRGGRLGRGKGFYDRFLAGVRGLKVGVCFADQVVESVPREPHDIAMDVLATPGGLIFCGPRSIG